jgi:hypothetical protein
LNLWNIYAKTYELLRSNPVSRIILQAEDQALKELLEQRIHTPKQGQALDLGTGRGNCIKLIPPDIIKLYAIDKSFEMVALMINDKAFSQPTTYIIPVLISFSFLRFL